MEAPSTKKWVVHLLSGNIVAESHTASSLEELQAEVATKLGVPSSRLRLLCDSDGGAHPSSDGGNDGVVIAGSEGEDEELHPKQHVTKASGSEEATPAPSSMNGYPRSVLAVVLGAPRAVVARRGGKLEQWDLAVMKCTAEIGQFNEVITAVCADLSAAHVAVATGSGFLRLFHSDLGKCVGCTKAHEGAILALKVCFSRGCAITAEDLPGCMVKVWDISRCHFVCLQSLEGHTDAVRALDVDFGSELIVSASDDTTLRVWNACTHPNPCRGTLSGHDLWVHAVCLDAPARRVLSASRDGSIRVWDLERLQCMHVLRPQQPPLDLLRSTLPASVALAGGPRTALVGLAACFESGVAVASDTRGSIHLWNLRTLTYDGAIKCAPARCFYGHLQADFVQHRVLVDFDPLLVLVDIAQREVISVSEIMHSDTSWVPFAFDIEN
mmetsp:Transcript_54446/g.129753  ORF Transcript_54446/g.129753 Transcript_54446/m.129753 type:complete len:440 (+) Transcript_54446:58-1377(+)|eukprot:CAMPEP_0178373960 /NCGR_PEP_ID=MMETSP0689_2-20121128/2132_1 /TAXON_ID=160604 /ORGANISM="Amphidinium massartii, Strain CS-259" /LENGTH=439 /DNA_ID=CAMNT_0019993919 /DNA_START=9 /DNA_END=1328 /DNA_ORIENTATION=+